MDARKLEALALMLAEERLARQAAERTVAELDTRLGEMAKLDAELLGIGADMAIKRLTEERDEARAALAEAHKALREALDARSRAQDAYARAMHERDEELRRLRRAAEVRVVTDGAVYGEGDKT